MAIRDAAGDESGPYCHLCFCDDDSVKFRVEVYRADVAAPLLVQALERLATLSPDVRVLLQPWYDQLAEVVTPEVGDRITVGAGCIESTPRPVRKWPLPTASSAHRGR